MAQVNEKTDVAQAISLLKNIGIIIKNIAAGEPIDLDKPNVRQTINFYGFKSSEVFASLKLEDIQKKLKDILDEYKQLYLAIVRYYLSLKDDEVKKLKDENEQSKKQVAEATKAAEGRTQFVKDIVQSLEEVISNSTMDTLQPNSK